MNPNSDLTTGISSAKSILLVLPTNPSPDAAAAALSLYVSLTSSNKTAKVVCPSPMTTGLSRLVGIDKVSDQVGNKNLVISFNVPEESIEKVSYNYDEGKLNFVVEPASGHPSPTSDQVSFSYQGIAADLILFVDVKDSSELGKLNAPDLANHPNQHYLTRDEGIDSLSSLPSYSLMASQLIESTSLTLDEDVATNLLFGLDAYSKHLSESVTPELLEAAAKCLRAGGTRQPPPVASLPNAFPSPAPRQNPPFPGRRFPANRPPRRDFPRPQFPKPQFGKPFTPPSPPPPAVTTPEVTPTQAEVDIEPPIDPSPDWFEPKIYKGSTLI